MCVVKTYYLELVNEIVEILEREEWIFFLIKDIRKKYNY